MKHKRSLDPLKNIEELTGESDRKKQKKKHKKEKDKDKNKSKKSIEELRAERLKREADERIKANRLIAGDLGKTNEPKVEVDDRKRKYNNQFNPDFSKY